MKFVSRWSPVLFVFVVGCAADSAPPSTSTSKADALGIASYDVQDSAYETVVVGRDASGTEVARMDLVHGRFTLDELFRDGYPSPEVDGRKLEVTAGAQRFVYEVGDFQPYMHMPPHPASQAKITAFLADPHVKPILDQWKLGWDVSTKGAEVEYGIGSTIYGSNVVNCNGQATCGNANTCGNQASAYTARRITTSGGYDMIAQCCPPVGTHPGTWFSTKKCMPNQAASECGPSGATCRACGQYDDPYDLCSVSSTSSAVYYQWGNPMTAHFMGEISGDLGYGANPGDYVNLYGGEYVTVDMPLDTQYYADSGVWNGNQLSFFYQGQYSLTVVDMVEGISATYYLY